ncbi:potassium-transporting ATPase subunit KdpA [Sphingobacterium sp. UT-1RO-CII-1]|uniref:potassium-transporting ATPase subunit KdpA n=1 Tax=Sphingobacterium sp. UT-1RO-CII-1 TaxID=2995225 RepID=UPI00227B710E|nr:potassium-transporting ATPase subunit KdpA [Sphingobacterium sp. UT-1RO-CII-1]MCY4780397.1 potassium-transporting ATPase subunit KdpA [Sphingobacterium sp. UT-1RO-CII-1]
MNTEIIGIVLVFGLAIALALPLGKYIAKVYDGEKTLLDPICGPIERLIYRTTGIKPEAEMNWKQHILALLTINTVWIVLGMLILMTQERLPLNPNSIPNMRIDVALNTVISFVVNCNLQHYAGESELSYLGQLWLMFLQFVSAATGMAAVVILFKAFKEKTADTLGNFYVHFIKSCTRILLPLSFIVATLLVFEGTPMTFEGKTNMTTLQGEQIQVSTGPAAAFIAIKHIGTNGGGFFGANSAHPFENPTYWSNSVEMIAQLLIPLAMVFAFGYFIKRKKLACMIFAVMTLGFTLLVVPSMYMEMQGNPAIAAMGIDNSLGAMEGKEVRFGAATSGFWSIATTVISTGSVNAMHDSMMPLSGMNQLLAMMINAFYGGVGVGVLNFFIFIILAVFISGLMVGRTPEFLGKKIEAQEMKIAMLIALLHPFLILTGTALAAALPQHTADTLNNPGFHGLSEMLYEYTSAAANNGSGFEGLADNTRWWNISTALVLLLSRFLPIIGPIAIAGLLASKRFVPDSNGTLKTDTATFGLMVFAVIVIVAALAFFPVLTLGPIAEYFSL